MTNQKIWTELCEAAVAFRELGCWEWMDDSTLFAVEAPTGGPTGYCSVMGQLGEFTALGVYLGQEGWSVLAGLIGGAFEDQERAFQFYQTCLMASFEDRNDLDEKDRALLKGAGINPRGRGAWPIFRSHRAGYYPWFIEESEAEFLKIALEQATWVGKQALDNPRIFVGPPGKIMTRVPAVSADGTLSWNTRWRAVPKILPPEPERPTIDLTAIIPKLQSLMPASAWAYDLVWLKSPMTDHGDRPVYPRLSFCLALESDLVIDAHVVSPHGYADQCCERLVNRMESMGVRPAALVVRTEAAIDIVEPIASALNIKIQLRDRLPELDRAINQLTSLL